MTKPPPDDLEQRLDRIERLLAEVAAEVRRQGAGRDRPPLDLRSLLFAATADREPEA